MTRLKRTNGEIIAESDTLTLRELCEEHKFDLEMADLARGNLKAAMLAFSSLRMASLWGADLEGSDLEGSELEETSLVGANLTKSNLRNAKLKGANLRKSTLRRANLEYATLSGANLEEVYGLWSGLAPSGRIAYAVDHGDKIMWQVGCRWAETQKIIKAIRKDYADRPAKCEAYVALIEAGVKVLEAQREVQS